MAGIMDKIKQMVSKIGAPTESASDYNLLLSYAGEWHPFIWGLMLGLGIRLSEPFPSLRQSILLTALILILYAFTGSKAKKYDLPLEMKDRYLKQIHKEPHYYGGGLILGYFFSYIPEILLKAWRMADNAVIA